MFTRLAVATVVETVFTTALLSYSLYFVAISNLLATLLSAAFCGWIIVIFALCCISRRLIASIMAATAIPVAKTSTSVSGSSLIGSGISIFLTLTEFSFYDFKQRLIVDIGAVRVCLVEFDGFLHIYR